MGNQNGSKTNLGTAARAGLAGAITATALNELGKRTLSQPPRMDIVGERALAGGMQALGMKPPAGRKLFNLTLAGDLISNSAYYSLVGFGDPSGAWQRGTVLGAAAGLGAALLPQRLGLGRDANAATPSTKALAFALYMVAGLSAAAVTSRS